MRENTSVFCGANNVFRTDPKVQSLIFEMDKNRTTISSISMVRPRPDNLDGRGVSMIILIVLELASFQRKLVGKRGMAKHHDCFS